MIECNNVPRLVYNTSPEDDYDKFTEVEPNKTFTGNEGFLFPNFTPSKLFVYQGLFDEDDWDSPYYSDEDDSDGQYHSDEDEESPTGEDDSDDTDSGDSGGSGGSDDHDEEESDEDEEGSDEYNSNEDDDENEVEDDSDEDQDEDQDEDSYEGSEKQHYPSLNTASNAKKSFWQKIYRKPMLSKPRNESRINWYREVFNNSWLHEDKTANFVTVYELSERHKTSLLNLVYKRGNTSGLRWAVKHHDMRSNMAFFHGTQRACWIGEKTAELCDNADCCLCSILHTSFRLDTARLEGNMFGSGIYSSTVSSKADTYAKNHYIRSQLHAVIVCTVIRGLVNKLHESNTSLVDPGDDYDTVEGLTYADGGSINFPETVVYHEDRILPRAVIMYTRKGWTPL